MLCVTKIKYLVPSSTLDYSPFEEFKNVKTEEVWSGSHTFLFSNLLRKSGFTVLAGRTFDVQDAT